MRPKRWIDPSRDTNVREGDLRIVRTKCGQVRAAKWQQNFTGGPWVYADRHGDGYDVVAVGVTWERKRSGPSGPSGKNTIPNRSVRVPDERWERFGAASAANGRDRTGVLNDLIDEYCARSK